MAESNGVQNQVYVNTLQEQAATEIPQHAPKSNICVIMSAHKVE